MYIATILFIVTLFLFLFLIGILKVNNIILKDLNNLELTYPSIISLFCNIIGIVIFSYSLKISRNIENNPSNILLRNLFYSYISLFYISFILILFFIWYKGRFINNKNYIIINFIFLLSMIPIIIFKDDLSLENSSYNREDKELIKIKIEDGGLFDSRTVNDEPMTKTNREIRERAASSELNERSDIDIGVYN